AKKRAFKFFNFVADKEEFLPFGEVDNKDVFENVKKIRDKLKELQINIDKAPDLKQLREEESIALKEYVASIKVKEKILYQKAKVKWLSVGDRNNTYFHKVLKSSNHKCRINMIHDGYGNKYEEDDVSEQFVRHFQNFLGEEVQVKHMKNINILIKNKLYEAKANEMLRDVSDAKIKEAMFLIDENKAPGLDWLSSLFFKRAWNIVGNDSLLCRVDTTNGNTKLFYTFVYAANEENYGRIWSYIKGLLERRLRNHKCRINMIHDGYGNKYEEDDVSEQFVRHFQNFLGEEVQVKHMKNINILIKNKLYEAKANEMLRDVSDAKIKEAMFLIDENKAPGLDWLSSLFFKRAWNIVGNDVCKSVLEFFVTGKLLSDLVAMCCTNALARLSVKE
nr:hypothetical protein [Tanacetum cinerariifolium]